MTEAMHAGKQGGRSDDSKLNSAEDMPATEASRDAPSDNRRDIDPFIARLLKMKGNRTRI